METGKTGTAGGAARVWGCSAFAAELEAAGDGRDAPTGSVSSGREGLNPKKFNIPAPRGRPQDSRGKWQRKTSGFSNSQHQEKGGMRGTISS